jgi:hypothetical protein
MPHCDISAALDGLLIDFFGSKVVTRGIGGTSWPLGIPASMSITVHRVGAPSDLLGWSCMRQYIVPPHAYTFGPWSRTLENQGNARNRLTGVGEALLCVK